MLDQNYPNPFRENTAISSVMESSEAVVLTVHDMFGRAVATLEEGVWTPSRHSLMFSAASDHPSLSPSVFWRRLQSGKLHFARLMKLLPIRFIAFVRTKREPSPAIG
jgi:hypothetical protein